MGSVLADIVAHIGQDAKWIVESFLVPARLLQECCEEEFLWESELTKIKAQDLKAKEAKWIVESSLVPSRLLQECCEEEFLWESELTKIKAQDLKAKEICTLPKDDEVFEHYDAYLTQRVAEANKIGKINLAAIGKDLMDDEKQEVTVDLFNASDMESEAVTERASEVEKNQSRFAHWFSFC